MNKKVKAEIILPEESRIEQVKGEAELLIEKAIDKGVPVETMEKLLSMRRELKAEYALAEYNKAMANFQRECPVISKASNAGSGSYTYKYADLAHIVSQVRELLSKNGFSYTFDTTKTENSIVISCKVNHVGGYMDTSKAEIAIDSGARMNISQKDGSAMTYGKRYAFVNAFGILTGDEDNDANIPQVKSEPARRVYTENGEGRSTAPQHKYIRDLLTQKGYSERQLCLKYDITSLEELTHDQASEAINGLKTAPYNPKKAIPPVENKEEEIDFDEADAAIQENMLTEEGK